MKKLIAGIDIGGTKISVVLATHRGRILSKEIIPTYTGSKSIQSVHEVIRIIQKFLSYKKATAQNLLGIGIGIPGPVHPKRQRIERSPNLPRWEKISLAQILKSKFHCGVYLENDANAAALGEKYFGSARKVSNFIYITVSTGIGSGIVLNRRLVQGAVGGAGELGHMTVQIKGKKCGCGKLGCLEAYASGTAIGRMARELLAKNSNSKMNEMCKNIEAVSGSVVSRAADLGDGLAIHIREKAADYLGVGIANVINLLNPDMVVLGGGVLSSTKHFWSPMMKAVKREAWPIHFKSCKIVQTKLKNLVGDYGTLALVLERFA